MVERICPQCQHGNQLENRFCGRCGANLEHPRALTRREQDTDLAVSGPMLPEQWKQVGKAMAVSLAALAAEAGMAWLRQRVDQMKDAPPAAQKPASQQSVSLLPRMTRSITPVEHTEQQEQRVTVWSQRVVQTWEHGTLTRQVVERTIWRREG
jgi:hypothetical protein